MVDFWSKCVVSGFRMGEVILGLVFCEGIGCVIIVGFYRGVGLGLGI